MTKEIQGELVERVARVLFKRHVYHGYNEETLHSEWLRTSGLHEGDARAAIAATLEAQWHFICARYDGSDYVSMDTAEDIRSFARAVGITLKDPAP